MEPPDRAVRKGARLIATPTQAGRFAAVRLRRALFQVHLWLGVGFGLYIVAVCVTGAALVFRIHLQRATFPHLFTPTAGTPADAATILERVREAFPNDRISGTDAPTDERPTSLAYVIRGNTFLTILVDPVTGRILGELPDRSIVRTIQDLHFDLFGGRTGRIVNGIGALILIGMCVTGIVIWWPGIAAWRRAITVDFRRNWKRVIWELHGAVGIWTVVLTFMWAATGVYFAWPSQVRRAINAISPLTVAVTPRSNPGGKGGAPPPSWREMIARAELRAPGQYVQRIVLPANDQAPFLVMFAPVRAPSGGDDLMPVYLDQYTGAFLTASPRATRSAGDVVMEWLVPLHVGNFGGTPIRIAWLILGLAPPLLFATGFTMWWLRVVRPRFSGTISARARIKVSR